MYRRSHSQPNANKGRSPGSGAACEDADLPRAPEAPPDAILQRVYRKGPQGWSLWLGMTVVLLGAGRSQARPRLAAAMRPRVDPWPAGQ